MKKMNFCHTDGILLILNYPNALYGRHCGLMARTLVSEW